MAYEKINLHEASLNPFKEIGDNWLLITAKTGDKVNTMTASWGALGRMWNKDAATIYLRPQRYTKEFVDREDLFTITMFEGHKTELTLLGRKSGRDGDKIAEAGFTVVDVDGQPSFAEGTYTLICRKMYADTIKPECFIDTEMDEKNYPQKDYHTMYIAEIVAAYKNV